MGTDKDSASSTENLINTPKRHNMLSTLKKQDSNTKPKPFCTGNILPMSKRDKKDEDQLKEENITSHLVRTTNHMENNFHLSNKKAIYYNMKVYYDATG